MSSLLRVEDGLPHRVQGAADPRFANVVRIFAGLFPGRRFGGGSLVVYGLTGRGRSTGRPTRVRWCSRRRRVWPANRGSTACRPRLLAYDTPVAEYWPEFGANGKADITVRDVLRHPSGVWHLKGVTKDDLLDHRLMVGRGTARLSVTPVRAATRRRSG